MHYKFKYTGNRQVDIENIQPAEIDDCFKVLREVFSIEWLEQSEINILQKLWIRKDTLSTKELFCLGFSIRSLISFTGFIKEKVTLIKSNEPKNINGALFEIFALSCFKHNYKTIPAKRNQAGYDGEINLNSSKKIRLSIKNYSISKHYEFFNKKAESLEILTNEYLTLTNSPPVEIIINKKTNCATETDWKVLFDNYVGIFVEYNNSEKSTVRYEIGDWSIIVQRLKKRKNQYSEHKKSYTLIISCPFHQNEEKNLFDKLEEACANIIKHESEENIDTKNFIFIHLPKNIGREDCQNWVQNYFNLYPQKPISCVILYQPLVISKDSTSNTYISNGLSFISRESLNDDFRDVLPINLFFPIGKCENEFPKSILHIHETEETAFAVELKNCYVFQQGHHYFNADTKDGTMSGEISKVASGVFTHSIFELLGELLEISGHFARIDQLEIL